MLWWIKRDRNLYLKISIAKQLKKIKEEIRKDYPGFFTKNAKGGEK